MFSRPVRAAGLVGPILPFCVCLGLCLVLIAAYGAALAAPTASLLPEITPPAAGQDILGVWFDTAATVDTTTVPVGQEVRAYLILKNASSETGVSGWEGELEVSGASFVSSGWDLTTGLNVVPQPRFQVGFSAISGVPWQPAIVLASCRLMMTSADSTCRIYIHPYRPASVAEPPGSGNRVGAPIYAAVGDVTDLRQLAWSSGNEALPVAVINPRSEGPICRLSNPLLDFGQLPVGAHRDKQFSVANLGGGEVVGDVAKAVSAAFTFVAGDGPFTLGPGEVHTFTVRFQPSQPGDDERTVDVCGQIRLAGSAFIQGTCSVAPQALDFGGVAVGSRRTLPVTITNVSAAPIMGEIVPPGAPFAVTSGTGEYFLNPGSALPVTVCYTPVGVGAAQASLDLGGGCSPVALSGTGLQTPPACAVSTSVLNFGAVALGGSRELSVFVINRGGGLLQGSLGMQGAAEGCAQFAVIEGGGPFTLAAGDSLKVTVRLTATSVAIHSCFLAVNDGAGSEVLCTGTTPLCGVSPLALDFGDVRVGSFATRSVTITNRGTGVLTLGHWTPNGPFMVATGATRELYPGEHVTVDVAFRPTVVGPATAALDLGGCGPVACTGNGTPGLTCDVSPSRLDFGSVAVGRVATLDFTVGNPNAATLSLLISSTSDRFVPNRTGIVNVPAAGSLTMTVAYHPAQVGSDSGTITLGVCSDVICTGTALEAPPACLVTPASLVFPSVPLGHSADAVVTIANDGGGLITGTVSLSGDQFSLLSGGGAFSLASGQARAVNVRYAPAFAGEHAGLLSFGTSGCADVPLYGGADDCTSAPDTLFFHALAGGGSHDDHPLTITNTGDAPIAGTVEASCTYFSIVSGAAFELQPGQSQSVVVRYAPLLPGQHICLVAPGAGCYPVVCIGSTVSDNEQVVASVDTLRFGTLAIGASRSFDFALRNTGRLSTSGNLTVTSPGFALTQGGGPFTVGPGQIHHAQARFTAAEPRAYAGAIQTDVGGFALPATGRGTSDPVDLLGVFFDRQGSTHEYTTTADNEVVTAYLLLVAPGEPSGVSGWECCLELQGNAIAANWTLAGNVLNVDSPPCFEVGVMSGSLPRAPQMLLATVTFVVPNSYESILFYVHPGTSPSLPGAPVYAAGRDPSVLIPLRPAYGGGTAPLASVNATHTGVIARAPDVACDDAGARLSWEYDSSDAPEFVVYRRAGADPAETLIVPAGAAVAGRATFVDPLPPPAGESVYYSYGVWVWGAEQARSPETRVVCGVAKPQATALRPVYPNPFNPQATVSFDLAQPGRARVEIFDLAGRKVRVLCDEELPAGGYVRHWDGRTERGLVAPSGNYCVRLTAGGRSTLRSMTLLR